MFIILLAVTFLVAAIVTTIVALLFQRSITAILQRVFPAEIAAAWKRYMTFAIYVVGISGGVRPWALEKFLTSPLALTRDRWVLEIVRTVLQALEGTAWLLFVFFVAAVVAHGIARIANRGKEGSA